MSIDSGALETKETTVTADMTNTKKENIFESAMVSIGSLVTYLASSAVKRSLRAVCFAARKVGSGIVPLRIKLRKELRKVIKKITEPARKLSDFNAKFSKRIDKKGFVSAVLLQASDIADAIMKSRRFAKTVVNYTVPVLGIALLISVVSDKASADYGVSVEYNGQEIGVVSEASVIDDAQKVIDERATYYDTGSETYITATLTLKPLGAQDTVIDEKTLAAAIQEQIETQAPVMEAPAEERELEIYGDAEGETADGINGEAGSADESDSEGSIRGSQSPVSRSDGDDRERAFVVTVDGEIVGAVTDNDKIDEFIENIKHDYLTDDVVDVSFDKEIEYTYEQFVSPDMIVDQEEIIDLLDSNVAEPVFYEVQSGDSPWKIAQTNDISLEELESCPVTFDGEEIEDMTKFLPVGAVVQLSAEVPYLGIMTTKEVTYSEIIDYDTITTEDPDMYKGDSVVNVKGVEGEKEVTALITYKNDMPVLTEVLSETIISRPVNKEMTVGTRETRTPVSEGSGGSGDYFWPVDGGRISAYQGDGRGHKGIDIAAPYGTPIYAAESGTVIETGSGWNGGYGNCIRIQHADGNVTLYGHQSSLAVEYGDYVVKGQLIGYVGSTGDSSGNHLHFEVRSNGTYLNPTNWVSQY
ncbi:MAG: peptidoglycan DD-metalloendopeptidase family protein [Oscillospiraceae bacterium]|nr:peptidoglycan DD-metalloendopeptidase family protein [Oscillospiraceae bacterium]